MSCHCLTEPGHFPPHVMLMHHLPSSLIQAKQHTVKFLHHGVTLGNSPHPEVTGSKALWVAGTRDPHQHSTHLLFLRYALGYREDLMPFFIYYYLLGVVVCFWNKVLLRSPGWSWTQGNLPASVSWVLGSQHSPPHPTLGVLLEEVRMRRGRQTWGSHSRPRVPGSDKLLPLKMPGQLFFQPTSHSCQRSQADSYSSVPYQRPPGKEEVLELFPSWIIPSHVPHYPHLYTSSGELSHPQTKRLLPELGAGGGGGLLEVPMERRTALSVNHLRSLYSWLLSRLLFINRTHTNISQQHQWEIFFVIHINHSTQPHAGSSIACCRLYTS